jgi:drug/metabolite transporter (DMT)-like permease
VVSRLSLSAHAVAVLQAILVTFLWSTSWILIKNGLEGDLPALTFAGLRYTAAFLCLLPVVLPRPELLAALRGLPRPAWTRLALLGVVLIAVTQGAQFLGLKYLPAATASLLLNGTPLLVALLGIFLLRERPTLRQWTGMTVFIAGIAAYFFPVALSRDLTTGLLVMAVGVLANAGSALLGRHINREAAIPPLLVAFVSMGVGAALLLAVGITLQGLPPFTLRNTALIVYLAVVNTAFAFTLWNHTQRTLSAVESSLINNTMLLQIAVLAWVFRGETLTPKEIIGLLIAATGVLIVQVRRR